jgi:hypothetical protein
MALWGKRDSFSITGTVAFVNTSNEVVGTSTDFATELNIGDMIITSGGTKFKVTGITNAEHLVIDPAWSTANASSQTITGQDTPKYLYYTDGRKTFGVDTTEAEATTKDAGWVLRNTYTDVHGRTRDKREVLVAMSSITADAEDTVYPDVVITITSQPENSSANTGDPVTFSVTATTLPAGVTLNYRWQANTGASWANLSDGVTGGGGNYANTNTATLEIDDNTGLDGYLYRVQIGATGAAANSVSDSATLTEVTP